MVGYKQQLSNWKVGVKTIMWKSLCYGLKCMESNYGAYQRSEFELCSEYVFKKFMLCSYTLYEQPLIRY